MKKLLVLILVLAAAYIAYQKFVVRGTSEEQKQVQALADDFAAVKQQMAQAETSAGATGMDMTSDVDTAMGGAEAVLKKLQELRESLREERALEMAAGLEAEIRAFLNRK
jgi:xanthine dehydrogenase iron-sulfur cluster and FAD-binding subunit A